jgi:DNA mismatch repair protein MutH
MSQTVKEIYTKLLPLVGNTYTLPKTKNKGLPGIFLQNLLGIPQTSDCLDCSDGELKLFPLKKLKNGKLVPKETIAVTMLDFDELRKTNYNESRCCKKMKKMLVVPYYRNEDTICFLNPKNIEQISDEYAELYKIIEKDYEEIQRSYLESGVLHSKTGTLLQSRTKGPGHGSTSRAFYLRPEFMKRCFQSFESTPHSSSTLVSSNE